MKSKKFVLAGLVLLAITGLLALAGCKNDSVPETPAAKLVSISVTPSEGTVYKVGDEVVHKKGDEIGVTAHYDNGPTRPVTGTITTDTNTLTKSAGVQTVTVRYSEGGIGVSGQFEIRVLPKELTDYTSPNNTGSEWTYVEFGEWPQTIKDASVNVYETKSKEMGMFTYYLGSDDNYYVKITAKPYEDTYTYSDGNPVEKDEEVYFKVEPIKWRVLNKDYASTGKAMLLAESILIGGIKWADSSNIYMESYIRQWLNGNSGTGETSDYGGDAGFLQTAFTESDWELIADTTVDNSGAASTTDKIFLLSEQEATTSVYGFAAQGIKDSTRIRVTTDYAKATGTYQDSRPGYGGWWWLRSPFYDYESLARGIDDRGFADSNDAVDISYGGVVPALSISLKSN